MPTITLQGRRIEYAITRSRRARYVRLTITLGKGLRVSAPLRVAERDIPAYIHEKADWVLRKLDEFARLERHMPHPTYRHGSQVRFLGHAYTLHVKVEPRRRSRVRIDGDVIEVSVPDAWETEERRTDVVARILTTWYGMQARRAIPPRVAQHAARMGITHARITIRRQKSRWGSCSSTGNLSFNQALMLLPVAVIDYVIIHELAHRVHLNHSKAFWELVERYCPDRRHHQHWLRAHAWYLDF